MNTLKRSQMVKQFAALKGARPISFVTLTEAKARKTGNPYLGALKRSYINGVIGFNYENSVNNQRGREGSVMDFQSQPRVWGHKISPVLVRHKEELYVEIKVEKALVKPVYFFNSEEIDKEKLKPWLIESGKNESQELEKEVVLRDYNIKNIIQCNYMGEFEIVDDGMSSEQIARLIIEESQRDLSIPERENMVAKQLEKV